MILCDQFGRILRIKDEKVLSNDGLDCMTMYISQPKISALVLKCQAFVINSQKMKNGCVKVMNVNSAFSNAVRIVI